MTNPQNIILDFNIRKEYDYADNNPEMLSRLLVSITLLTLITDTPITAYAAVGNGNNGAESKKFEVTTESADAEASLQYLMSVIDVPIIYAVDEVRGVKVNPLNGTFTPEEALNALVKNTDLTVIHEKVSGIWLVKNTQLQTNGHTISVDGSTSDNKPKTIENMTTQNNRNNNPINRFMRGIGTLLFAGASVTATAQDDATDEENVFNMSPFIIQSSEESGYVATSSLAGSRIKADLSEIGSAISVYTEEFMEDIAATDTETLLSYTLNTEVGGFRGNFVNPTGEGIESANLDQPHLNTRVRGLTRADNTLNYYRTDVPWDGYIIRRVDIQRGANSVLFGLGSPAGIINATKIEAEFDTRGEVQVRFDEFGSYRLVGDYNAEIIEDQLAVRVAILNEDRQYQQDPAFEDRERTFVTFTWQPDFLNTDSSNFQLKGSFETGSIESNRPRNIAPTDRLTPWLMPTSESGFGDGTNVSGVDFRNIGNFGWNRGAFDQFVQDGIQTTGNEGFNPWLASTFDGPEPLYLYNADGTLDLITEKNSLDRLGWFYTEDLFDDGVTAAIFNDGRASSDGTSIERHIPHPIQHTINGKQRAATDLALPFAGFWQDSSFTDTTYFDFFNNLIDGDGKREYKDFDIYELEINHTFFDNKVGYNAGYFKQEYDTAFYSILGNVFTPGITVDVGALDRTATGNNRVPNPRFGEVVVREDNASGNISTQERESARFQAFLRHDFTKEDNSFWRRLLGSHDLVGIVQNRKLDQQRDNFPLTGAGRDYLFNRTESVPDASTPGPGSRFAEYSRNLGNPTPNSYFYLNANADYTGISQIQADLNSIPNGLQNIFGFDARPLPGFDAVAATVPWTSWFGIDAAEGGDFQSRNPENYVGWRDVGQYTFVSALAGDAEREYLTTTKNFFTEDVDSIAGVWTGRWLNGGIVGMYGWRRDEVVETWYEHDYRDDGPTFNLATDRNSRDTEVESRNWSVKANLTYLAGLSGRMPFDIHVLYSEGQVQTPDPSRVDVFGRTLPNATGDNEDISVMLTSADGRWSFRATKYETIVKNAISSASVNNQKFRVQQVLQQGAFRAGLIETDAQNYTAPWLTLSPSAAAAGFDNEADYRRQVMAPAWREFERGLFEDFPLTQGWYISEFQPGDQTAPQILFPDNATIVEDTISEGWEFEFVGNPTDNWNLAINVSQTDAIRDNLPGDEFGAVVEYIVAEMQGPAGEIPIWWFAGPGVGTWLDPFLGELTKAQALNGSTQPEIREWKANIITNYSFNGGKFDGFGVGGAYRYEDAQIYGYGISENEDGSTNVDISRGFADDARNTIDLWVSYRRPLTDKIDWRVQLNIFNAFADDELVPLHLNPDGSFGRMGIRPGTSWQITNTFSF